jgi:hypothetical protein
MGTEMNVAINVGAMTDASLSSRREQKKTTAADAAVVFG